MPAQTFKEQLQALRRDLELARQELVRAVEAVPDDLFGAAPRGEWSVDAMLRHVVKSEHLYASGIDLLRGRAAAAPLAERGRLESGDKAMPALAVARKRFLTALEGVTEDEFYEMKQLGFNEESIKSILENVAMHDREHAHQIAKTVTEVAEGL